MHSTQTILHGYPIEPARLQGLNGDQGAQVAVAAAGAASASIAAGGATAGALIAFGVSAQAVPVIGNILGAIALIGGYILSARAKAKAIKGQVSDVNQKNIELLKMTFELDSQINQANQRMRAIQDELNRLGINGGLNGFSDWLKKTFTPVRYQEGILADANAENTRLTNLIEQKISTLQSAEVALKQKLNELTTAKIVQRLLLWGGIAALLGTGFYFLNKEYKWI